MFEFTKKFCDGMRAMGLPGFDLAVYKDGKPVLRYMGGYSDLENRVPMDGKERYFIYSCSKPITCTAAMQLWEKGLFKLEDPLYKYIPEFEHMQVKTPEGLRPAKKPIRIHHLFEMTAGFTYDLVSPSLKQAREDTLGKCPTLQAIRYLAKEPLLFEPGTRWHYSLCHDVLGALVEVLSGQRFEEYVKAHIFEPLGMKDSTYLPEEKELSGLAPQYTYDADVQKAVLYGATNKYRLGSQFASGGAGCVSTVDDYMKFLEGLRQGKLLKQETIDLIRTNRLTETQAEEYWIKRLYGYGLGVRCKKEGSICNDFGWDGAAAAYLSLDLERGISIFLGTHLLSSPTQSVRAMLHRLVCCELTNDYDFDALRSELQTIYKFHYFD